MTRQPKDWLAKWWFEQKAWHGPVGDWHLVDDPTENTILVRVRCAACGRKEIGGAFLLNDEVWVAMRPDEGCDALATLRGQHLTVTCSCSMTTTIAADTLVAKVAKAHRTNMAQSVRVGPIT